MTLNLCQADHQSHESKLVQTEYGPWHIWDWSRYMDFPNYCTGQDEVSKSIEITGWWEKPDTDHMLGLLKDYPGDVWDLGSHIGWFSVLAAEVGCRVFAVDADPQNMLLMTRNIEKRNVLDQMSLAVSWVAGLAGAVTLPDQLRFLKVDIEGHEHEALALTRNLWKQQRIDYGLWELSPVFENRENIMSPSYADLVDEIASYGYRWYILKGEDRWYIEGKNVQEFQQENGWCEKLP